MLPGLVTWLTLQRRLTSRSMLYTEVPWFGRRVDVALKTPQSLLSFELKLRNNRRAIEQASYNGLAFDKSFIVTGAQPSSDNLRLAHQAGVGILWITSTAAPSLLLAPQAATVDPFLRGRLESVLSRHPRLVHDVHP